jgi:hypothetical protein
MTTGSRRKRRTYATGGRIAEDEGFKVSPDRLTAGSASAQQRGQRARRSSSRPVVTLKSLSCEELQ